MHMRRRAAVRRNAGTAVQLASACRSAIAIATSLRAPATGTPASPSAASRSNAVPRPIASHRRKRAPDPVGAARKAAVDHHARPPRPPRKELRQHVHRTPPVIELPSHGWTHTTSTPCWAVAASSAVAMPFRISGMRCCRPNRFTLSQAKCPIRMAGGRCAPRLTNRAAMSRSRRL